MGPVHEDEWAALNDLLRIGRGDIDTQLDVEEIAQTIFEENAALNEIKDVDLDNEDDSEDEGDVSEASIALIADITDENLDSWKIMNHTFFAKV